MAGRPDEWTSTAALWFAGVRLAADEVDIYGMDMVGTHDFHGRPCMGRSDARWRAEAEQVAAMINYLTGKHIAINRKTMP